MPGRESESHTPVVYPLHHGLKAPVSRVAISWSHGNCLRASVFVHCQPEASSPSGEQDRQSGGKVLEVRLASGDGEISDTQWRRIVYGSASPFALLQSRKNSISTLSQLAIESLPNNSQWMESVMEFSKEIKSLVGSSKLPHSSVIEDPKEVYKKVEEPNSLKAAWELMELFYVDKDSQTWLNERLLDWLADYDGLFSGMQQTIHLELVDFQKELLTLQAVEDASKYWDALSSALAVGWLEIVVKLLRLHGSYQLEQLGYRETENGLVEAVAVLISKMPRLRPDLPAGKLGVSYKSKPDFVKALEKWRAQILKLECSPFWLQCAHRPTRDGLKNMLQILLGNAGILSKATYHWMELFISHSLYIRPFTMSLESMYILAEKCMQMKPTSTHKLTTLLVGILGENTEVVLAECTRSFGPWMSTHAVELLSAGSIQAERLLHEKRHNLGAISIEELNRLVYAQVLSSHPLTWQIAPIYLASCEKEGMGLLETVLCRQPVQDSRVLLKSLEICRLYDLDTVGSSIKKVAGMYNWKHGKKGSGVFWLQQARDEVRLNRIAGQLFDFVGKSVSDKTFQQWEGLIELLGSEPGGAGGLEFLHVYKDFKRSLQQVHDGAATDTAKKAAETLVSIMKNPATPPRFWLPLLYDSLKLLDWKDGPLLDVSQTNLLLNKLQELSMAKLRPDFAEPDLPPKALSSVRLALATNLGRAILEE